MTVFPLRVFRGAAMLVMIFSLVLILALTLVIVPMLVNQFNNMVARLPQIVDFVQNKVLPWINMLLGGHLTLDTPSIVAWLQSHTGSVRDALQRIMPTLMKQGRTVVLGVTNLFLLPFLLYYFLLDWQRWAHGIRAMVPSSFMISQITAAGVRPASAVRSQPASVWPARMSTPPFWARSGKMWPGFTRSDGFAFLAAATWIVRARSAAEMPVETPVAASIDTVKAVPCRVPLRVAMGVRFAMIALALSPLFVIGRSGTGENSMMWTSAFGLYSLSTEAPETDRTCELSPTLPQRDHHQRPDRG